MCNFEFLCKLMVSYSWYPEPKNLALVWHGELILKASQLHGCMHYITCMVHSLQTMTVLQGNKFTYLIMQVLADLNPLGISYYLKLDLYLLPKYVIILLIMLSILKAHCLPFCLQ